MTRFCFRLAEEKKEEGNQLYKVKQYRDALSKYTEAIGEFRINFVEMLENCKTNLT